MVTLEYRGKGANLLGLVRGLKLRSPGLIYGQNNKDTAEQISVPVVPLWWANIITPYE